MLAERHAELGGDVADSGLEIAELAEEPLRGLDDSAARGLRGRMVDGADAHALEKLIAGCEPARHRFPRFLSPCCAS